MPNKMVISQGHVIDPANNINRQQDIYISYGKIVKPFPLDLADIVINARNKYVFPGLIDYHAHIFYKGTEYGVNPDSSFLCQGVTSVVDPGSAGVSNIEAFIDNIASKAQITVQGYLNLSPTGINTLKYNENYDPQYWDTKQLAFYLSQYKDLLQGLKIRISRPIVGNLGLPIMLAAKKMAVRLKTRLCVHITDSAVGIEKIASLLDKNDIMAHCYEGTGNNILDSNGKVLAAVLKAQKRGVIMDAANGATHWQYKIARQAFRDGLYPDIISTDITTNTLFKPPVFGLPFVMSKYLLLGMSLFDIVKACTATPGKLMRGKQKLGTLSYGAQADVAIFDLKKKKTVFSDAANETATGSQLLIPALTICKGHIAYQNMLY